MQLPTTNGIVVYLQIEQEQQHDVPQLYRSKFAVVFFAPKNKNKAKINNNTTRVINRFESKLSSSSLDCEVALI